MLTGYKPEIVATAVKADQQLSNAAATTVANVMTSGLQSGENAVDLWEQIESAVDKMPEDRKQHALQVAKGVQVDFITGKAMGNVGG